MADVSKINGYNIKDATARAALDDKQDTISDLSTIRAGAALGATAVQPESGKGLFSGAYDDLTGKPTIPSAVTEDTVSGWGFTKNTGTYVKPSDGIPTGDIANSAVTAGKIANGAVTSPKIANSAVTTALIQGLAVTSAKLASSAVTTDKIKAEAVTLGKLSTEVQGSLAKADTALQSVPSTYRTAAEQDIIDDTKSSVSVSATGTATDVVKYIIIDGVEKKLPSSEISPEVLENFITAEDEDPSSPASKDADTLGGHIPAYYAQKEYVDTQLAQKYVKPSGGIPTTDLANASVTRTKVSNDVLYSPLVVMNDAQYIITNDDCGKTFRVGQSAQFVITLENSQTLPSGFEMAIIHYGKDTAFNTTIFFDGVPVCAGGERYTSSVRPTIKISDSYSMVAIKKITAADTWLVTGNVEVV